MLKEMQDVEFLTRDELLDILYKEYVKEAIKRGEEEIKNGRVYTLKEFIDSLVRHYENNNI